MRSILSQLLLAAAGVRAVFIDAKKWKDFQDGSDLTHFVTRPELKAPRYMVAKHHPESISPGYWFVTPYTRVGVTPTTGGKDYLPCTNGAHIYDGEGELVWSGACLYDNRNVFNFRPLDINGSSFFTFFLPGEEHGFNLGPDRRLPAGVLMNNQYEEVSKTRSNGSILDGHEFRILPGGQTTLLTTLSSADADAKLLGQQGIKKVLNTGFQEEETGTSIPVFNWDPISYGVMINESCDTKGMTQPGRNGRPWDFFHINSVDKFDNGDYLVSGRHMSTIYRISGVDGHIIWRLGGCYEGISDFAMEEGLPFFWQHHARIRSENATHLIISLFDNESEDTDRGFNPGRTPPVGKIMILDTKAMTAKMLRRFDRPDGGQSPALGSVMVLDDDVYTSNVFIDWAFDGYISEYDGEGRLIMEARFLSDRKKSYRAYKLPFKGMPTEAPVLKVLPIGYSDDEAASAFYVSWNGATEVVSWAFYGGQRRDMKSFKPLAMVKRRGFETSWVCPGVVKYAYAEAFDRDGNSIGFSPMASLMPKFHPHYEVAYPALQNIKTTQPQPLQAPEATKEEVAQGPSSEKQTSPPPPVSTPPASAKPPVPPGAPPIIIYIFAAYGLFAAIRGLYQLLARRRKGYQAIPSYSDVETREAR